MKRLFIAKFRTPLSVEHRVVRKGSIGAEEWVRKKDTGRLTRAELRLQHVSYHASMCAKADALRRKGQHELAHAIEEASRLTFYELDASLGNRS
jgi:hypothetical protein